jgi:hypothetical protein
MTLYYVLAGVFVALVLLVGITRSRRMPACDVISQGTLTRLRAADSEAAWQATR